MHSTQYEINPLNQYYEYALNSHIDLLVAFRACGIVEDHFRLPADPDQLRLIDIKKYFNALQDSHTMIKAIFTYCRSVSSILPSVNLDQTSIPLYQLIRDQKHKKEYDDKNKMINFLTEEILSHLQTVSMLQSNLPIVRGHKDLNNKIYSRVLKKDELYKGDEKFSWPINQIGSLPVYAAKGPVEPAALVSNRLFAIDFFLEISGILRKRYLQEGQDKGLDINTIFALGEPGEDFVDYFQRGANKTFSFSADNCETKRVCIETLSSEIHKEHFPIHEYLIAVTVYDVAGEILTAVHEKKLTVINMRIPDGSAVKYTELALHHQLIQSLKKGEGILVHCKAGLGRTGQVVAQLLAIAEGKAETFFTPDGQYNIKAISAFVTYLRTYRPGLILEHSQLLAFLMNVKQLHLSLANNDPLQKSAHQTFFTPEVKKSDKSEKEEQPTKKKKLA